MLQAELDGARNPAKLIIMLHVYMALLPQKAFICVTSWGEGGEKLLEWKHLHKGTFYIPKCHELHDLDQGHKLSLSYPICKVGVGGES